MEFNELLPVYEMKMKKYIYFYLGYYYYFCVVWIFHIVDIDSLVSMTAELDSDSVTERQLCGYIDVNPLSHRRDNNAHNRRKHGEL